MSIAEWLDRVRKGEAPKPVIQRNRFTRWRLADVRAYYVKLAAGSPDDAAAAARLVAHTTKASAVMQANKRRAAAGQPQA